MNTTITIQPAEFIDNVWVGKTGKIVEGKKMPYPFHIDASTGDVLHQDFWQGDPYRCIGFQSRVDVQHVDLWWPDAAADPSKIEGMYAVFVKERGGMYTYTLPIESAKQS